MSSSDSDASSVAHENKKKKVKARVATPPAKKKVKPPPTAEQIAKTTRDIDDVVSSLGTPASKSSSGEKSPFHKDSICNKLREHFVLVKKEDGGREVTCKLCSAEKPWTMCVDSLNGFGNVGKHFRRHHKKEYDRAGCGTNHVRVVEKKEETAAENVRAELDPCRELLHMVARLRLPFAVIDDKWFRRIVKERGIKVELEGEKTRALNRRNVSACMDAEKEKLLHDVLSNISDKLVSVNMDNGTAQEVRTTVVCVHADGWSFPAKVLDCPLGSEGEEGRAAAAKMEKDLTPFFDELKMKYNLEIVSITTDNCPAILNAAAALAAGIKGCFTVNCGCHVEQLLH